MVGAIDDVMPGAAVPVIVAREVEDAGILNIERDVEIVGELVEEMAGIGAFVAAGAVVGASHVGAGADALIGPAVPGAVGVVADGDDGRIGGFGAFSGPTWNCVAACR